MPVIAPIPLRVLMMRLFETAGWPAQEAAEVARHLVLANLSGHDSHGVGMAPIYLKALADGVLHPAAQPVDIRSDGAFLIIDAKVALRQPAARRAVERAMAVARRDGVAILSLINAHHLGRIGDYAEQVAEAGLVGLFWVNVAGRPPIVAPHGGRAAAWGTNPHAIGMPSRPGEPLILDFATSRLAHGKVRVALNKGEPVAPGHLIDADGAPTSDPAVAFPPGPMGALLPFGEHKGAGLGLIAEILSAALAGGAQVTTAPHRSWILNSMLAVLIDPARLDPDHGAQTARVAALADYLRAITPVDPTAPVLAPGDKERLMRRDRERDGIPIDDETWQQITDAARTFGLDANAIIAR